MTTLIQAQKDVNSRPGLFLRRFSGAQGTYLPGFDLNRFWTFLDRLSASLTIIKGLR